jgi:hypothetical protein
MITGAAHSDVVWENDSPTQTTDFDFSEIDRNVFGVEPEDTGTKSVSFSDMSAALSIILAWIQGKSKTSANPASVASRALGLLYLLDPVSSHYKSLDDIGKACGLTRAAISRCLVSFREEVGIAFSIGGKCEGSRENYSRSQRAAVVLGTHSSFSRKK